MTKDKKFIKKHFKNVEDMRKIIFDFVESLNLDKESKKIFIKQWLNNIEEVLNND